MVNEKKKMDIFDSIFEFKRIWQYLECLMKVLFFPRRCLDAKNYAFEKYKQKKKRCIRVYLIYKYNETYKTINSMHIIQLNKRYNKLWHSTLERENVGFHGTKMILQP